MSNSWPGLAKEVDQLAEMLKVENPKTTQCGRKVYNEMVKTACKWRDEVLMKEEMEPMKEKKMRTMFHHNLGLKDYVKRGTLFTTRLGRSGATCLTWLATFLVTGNTNCQTGIFSESL